MLKTEKLSEGKSANEMRAANPENFNPVVNGRMIRPPLRTIYIYSVARRDFGPLNHTLFPKLLLAGCTGANAKRRFVLCAKVPDPIPQSSPDLERGGTRVDEIDGWRAVCDLLNPNNPTNDPYFNTSACTAWMQSSTGCNLISQGVWPSLNEHPKEEEIARAEHARDDYYRGLTQKAIRLEGTNPRALNEFLAEHPDVHTAMDMLGLDAAWHKRQEVKGTCPNCGDLIPVGIAFHQSKAGVLCIIDPAKAFRAGAINRQRYEELIDAQTDTNPRRGTGRPTLTEGE